MQPYFHTNFLSWLTRSYDFDCFHIIFGYWQFDATERTHTNVTRNASNITAKSLTKKTDAQPMLVGSISLVVTSQVLLLLAIFGQVIILDISWYFVVGLMYTSNVSQHCSKFISIWRLPTLLSASSVLLLKPQPSFLSFVFFSTPSADWMKIVRG